MNKNITYILIGAIVLTVIGIIHYETTKTEQALDPLPIATTSTSAILEAYNQGKAEGQNAMRTAIISRVSTNDEVALEYKINTEEGVKTRVIILIEKHDQPTKPTE